MAQSEVQIKKASASDRPYKLADGEGLFLLVQRNGSKLWRLKYRFRGKEKLLSFGPLTTAPTRGKPGSSGQGACSQAESTF